VERKWNVNSGSVLNQGPASNPKAVRLTTMRNVKVSNQDETWGQRFIGDGTPPAFAPQFVTITESGKLQGPVWSRLRLVTHSR
jgi:hypothetical protein